MHFKKNKKIQKLIGGFFLAAGCFAYTWLFPQIAFQDCVHPVIIRENGTAEEEADAVQGNGQSEDLRLSGEDYIRLFDPGESNFKVAWKFMREK